MKLEDLGMEHLIFRRVPPEKTEGGGTEHPSKTGGWNAPCLAPFQSPPPRLPTLLLHWPGSLKSAYYDLLKQLNAICRERHQSLALNPWIAETAIRQVRGEHRPQRRMDDAGKT